MREKDENRRGKEGRESEGGRGKEREGGGRREGEGREWGGVGWVTLSTSGQTLTHLSMGYSEKLILFLAFANFLLNVIQNLVCALM